MSTPIIQITQEKIQLLQPYCLLNSIHFLRADYANKKYFLIYVFIINMKIKQKQN